MRIVSGRLKGIRFRAPKGIPTRPTTDIAKEGLFNILASSIDFAEENFLDLFAGTGAISYEMASRGCTNITAIDNFQKCVEFYELMIEKHGIEGMKVYKEDVFSFIARTKEKYSLIFAGPPYGLDILDEIPNRIFDFDLLAPNGLLILEHNPNHNFDDHEKLRLKRNYGQTIFSIFLNK